MAKKNSEVVVSEVEITSEVAETLNNLGHGVGEDTSVILVNQPDETQVLEIEHESTLPMVESEENKLDHAPLSDEQMRKELEASNSVAEPVKVVKVVVPKSIKASLLDDYDTALINLVLGSNLLGKAIEAIENAPGLKENMVKDALLQQESATQAYTSLMSKGIVMPFTPEFDKLQEVMLALHSAKQAEEIARNTDVTTLAESSIKAMRDSLTRDIEAIRLSVFGKETENSGRPEGSPKTNGKKFIWQQETTISYHRYGSYYHVCPVGWLSVEYRQEHGINVSECNFVAINDVTGKIVMFIPEVKGYSAMFAHIDKFLGHDTFEGLTNGTNMTSIGSNESEANKAKFPTLTHDQLREKLGDKGNDFTLSISEEIGKDDETQNLTVVVTQAESVGVTA